MGVLLPIKRSSSAWSMSEVESLLAGKGNGSAVDLYGPGGLVGTFEQSSSGVRAKGWICLANADASTGLSITLGSSSAPAWATAGASGGLVLPGDGDLIIESLGQHKGDCIMFAAMGVISQAGQVDGHRVGAGGYSASASAVLGGCAVLSSGQWYRHFCIGDLGAVLTSGVESATYEMPLIESGDTLSFVRSSFLTDLATGAGAWIAGACKANESSPTVAQPAGNSAMAMTQRNDQRFIAFAYGASLRLTHVKVSGGD